MEKRYIKDIFLAGGAALVYFAVVIICGAGVLKAVGGWKFVQYIVIAPLAEEIIFRGFLQKFVKEKISLKRGQLTAANVLVSAVFALFHLITSVSFHALSVFFPSLIFGLIYDRNNSIIPCIAVHSIFNLNIFIVYQSGILMKIFGVA